MKILGIDPGTATVGWAVIEKSGSNTELVAYGHISTAKDKPAAARLAEIAADLEEILTTYKPDEAAVEELFFTNNQKTAMAVGQARGCILLTLERFCIKIYEYTPPEIKQAVTNSGRADKRDVQEMVRRILHLKEAPEPDDAADAIAVALCRAARRNAEQHTDL